MHFHVAKWELKIFIQRFWVGFECTQKFCMKWEKIGNICEYFFYIHSCLWEELLQNPVWLNRPHISSSNLFISSPCAASFACLVASKLSNAGSTDASSNSCEAALRCWIRHFLFNLRCRFLLFIAFRQSPNGILYTANITRFITVHGQQQQMIVQSAAEPPASSANSRLSLDASLFSLFCDELWRSIAWDRRRTFRAIYTKGWSRIGNVNQLSKSNPNRQMLSDRIIHSEAFERPSITETENRKA